ncbi:hypothetical protein CPB97_011362 [Podila verticillata]|nr:hypothetical protein CPB97_011362 [Podila verticillata]
MFGSAFGANGGANMNIGNTNNMGSAFNNYSNNQSNSNWNAGGAGNDGGGARGGGRGRGGNYRGRGGANRGSNMTYVAPGVANGISNHPQQQQQQQHQPFQQPFQRGRGGGGYVPRGRGRGAPGAPGQYRSIQWRPDNAANASQNIDMDDDMSSDLGTNQWAPTSSTAATTTSAFSAFGSTPAAFTTTAGSAFNSNSGRTGSLFNSGGPTGSAFSSSTAATTFAPSSGFNSASTSGFNSAPTNTAFNMTTNTGSAFPSGASLASETKERPSGSAFGSAFGTAFGDNNPSMATAATTTFLPKATIQNARSALVNSALSSSSSAPTSSTLRALPKFQDQDTPEDAESRLARFSAVPIGNRYEELKEKRVLERQEAIRKGTIPDPDKPRRLEDAITFVGTCQDMCPEFERHEREYQQSIESFEKIPGTDSVDHARAVKIYARSAAGNEQALPSDVRPPKILLSTLEYLIKEIVTKGELSDSHGFVRDRTRSIRQDFTLQNSRGMEAIEAHEIIARYHILCIHQLCEVKNFSNQQEMEQLRKVLTSLQEFYDDMRAEGISCPNEPEFRAYHMLSHMWDPDMLRQAQQLPRHVFQDPYIQAAAEIHTMTRRNNDIRRRAKTQSEASPNLFSRFFKKVAGPSVTYLMACLVETNFAEVRKGALKAINKTYMDRHGGIPIDDVMDMLGFDDVEECVENCQEYDLAVSFEGKPSVVVGRKDENKRKIFKEGTTGIKQRRSMRIVEAKREHFSDVQIIYGETPRPGNGKGPVPRLPSVSRLSNSFTTPQRNQPIATSGSIRTGSSTLPTTQPVLTRLSTTQPPQAQGMFNFGINTTTKPTLPQVTTSAGSQSVFAKQPSTNTFQFGVTSSGSPSTSVPSAPTIGLGVSSALNPLASSFKPVTPSPLQPALSIPPPSATPFSAPSQPSQFNFKAPAQAPPVSTQPPAFNFKAPIIPSTPPAPSGGMSFSTPTAKSSAGFTGTVSTAPFSISTGAANATPVLIPPPSPISTPKTDALTIVTKRGRIYPRSVVESVCNEIRDEAIDRFTRSIVAQVHHDTSMERSIRRAEERKHAVRIEEVVIMNGVMDQVMRGVLAEICSEIYRETQLQRWVVRKWREFAIKSRKRAEELKRRQEHYLANVRALSSRAGLGEDEMAIKIRDYKAEQDRINRRPRSYVDQDDLWGPKRNDGVKAMVESVNKKRRRLMVLEQEGSPDNALLAIMKEAAAPTREMWAPVLIQEIVEHQYKETHPSIGSKHHPWRLFVNTPDFKETSSKWLMTKLGTDMGRSTKVSQRSGHMTTSHRRTDKDGMDVVVHGFVDESLQDLTSLCPSHTIMETSSLIFVFSKVPFADSQATETAIHQYWNAEKLRLARFLSCFKGVKQPLVLVMWGEPSMWETLSPYAIRSLELDTIVATPGSGVARYSFLVMDLMANMKLDRYIAGALEWLAAETRDPVEDQSARLSRIALD